MYYHVTVLSNFARAYDKYGRCYDKSSIPESRFPDRFYVTSPDDIAVGIAKASALLHKLNIPGNGLLAIQAPIPPAALKANEATGKGLVFSSPRLPVGALHAIRDDGAFEPIAVEEAYAQSLSLLAPALLPYDALVPRTLSVLPVARACQAKCRFCFSASSASLEQSQRHLKAADAGEPCRRARAMGARRFVITGGGEPGLLPHADLLDFIRIGDRYFDKVVLITNGAHLGKLNETDCSRRLGDYATNGLSVLSISRHHHDADANRRIMGIDTRTERICDAMRGRRTGSNALRLRFICVLQKDGVQDDASLAAYVDWATAQGVEEVCFKELYVSTFLESAYHASDPNVWAREHQVPISLVTNFFTERAVRVTSTLPWGSPVFEGTWNGCRIKVAAYAEPSLFWERSRGIARSWNVMADGQCLVSLEDSQSALHFANDFAGVA